MPIIRRDYETRSTINLADVGAWRYATHDTTEIWCCAYAVDDGPIKLWVPGDPIPPEFIAAAQDPTYIVAAFNDHFERLIEQHIMGPRHGWPIIPIERHRCLQASALALALPAKLEGVAKALNLEQQKDIGGHKLMLQMSKPRRPRQHEDPPIIHWFDDPERIQRLHEYCRQDVATERALYACIGFLSDPEQELWQLDAAINDRGIYIDGELLDAAINITDAAQRDINAELQTLTGISSISQTKALMTWLAAHNCEVTDLQKPTLEKALTCAALSPEVRRAIELRLDGAHTTKLDTMRAWRNPDGRARGTLRFHGASTGRWSSHGIQLQNMKRPVVEDIDAAIAAVAAGDLNELRNKFPQPMAVVGDITRALICAAPGHHLIAADFSGIESRVTAWLSGQQSKLDQWAKFDRTRDSQDEPYFIIGHKMFGLPADQARITGKTADLAFGFMGGEGAWRRLAPEGDASTKADIERFKRTWRNKHQHTVRFWHNLNNAAVQAVAHPGTEVTIERLTFCCDDVFLRLRLPSGRTLAYPFPRLKKNDRGDNVVVFMDNEIGKWIECRHGNGAYGGTWIENAVQAVARDLFAAAMPRLEAAGYKIVLHVHDEIVAEVPNGFGSAEEFLQIITAAPLWADGLPIAAKVRNGQRFCKTTPKSETTVGITPDNQPAEEGDPMEVETVALAPAPKPKTGLTDIFDYTDENARLLYQVLKYNPKDFKQRRPNGNGGFIWSLDGVRRVPYRWPDLLKHSGGIVFVCEGEKDANRVAALGHCATTVASNKWTDECIQALANRDCLILEDNDSAGRQRALKAANVLHGVAKTVRIVHLPDLGDREDVSDWLDADASNAARLLEICLAAPLWEGEETVQAQPNMEERVDIDLELESIRDGGSANAAHCRIIPSMLLKGVHPNDVLVHVVNATMAQAREHRLDWTAEKETPVVVQRIISACNNLLLKDYNPSTDTVPDWLPEDFHNAWIERVRAGRRPVIGFNRCGFYVRSYQQSNQKPDDSKHTNGGNNIAENGEPVVNGERKFRFRLVSFQDMRPGLEPVYLVDELIPSAGLVLVWGKQKTYKSFWLLDLMLHIVMGWQYRDRAVRQGAVIYCAFEGAHGYKGRIEALRRHYGIADDVAVPLYVMPGQADLIHDEKTLIADFREQLCGTVPTIVVLDTLNRSLKGSENSDEDMTKYTRAAEAIRSAFGCVVVIVHHCGYDDTHARGHTSLPAAVDAELSIARDEGSPLFLATVINMRDGPEGTTVRCRAQTIPLEADQNGRPRSSIVIVPDDSPVDPRQKGRKDTAYPTLMRAMHMAVAAHGVQFEPDGQKPVRAVTEKDVRTLFYRNYIDAEDDTAKSAEAQKSAFKRALRKALEVRVICGQKNDAGVPVLWFTAAITGH